jgi:hypothetical protein
LAPGAAAAQPSAVSARFKDGLIFVDGQMYGVRGIFLLDTGAAASAVDPHFATAARLHISQSRAFVTGRGGGFRARKADAAPLQLIGGPQARIAPVVTDLDQASQAMGVSLAGILGQDFLRGFVVTLDYKGQTVSLADAAVAPPDAAPLHMGAVPYVEATALYDGRQARGLFQIDTGSNTAVEFWRPFAEANLGRGLGAESVGLGVAGLAPIARGRIDALEVAGRRIEQPDVNFADETRDEGAPEGYGGVIGGPAWNGLVLTLDLPHGRMWLR